MQPTAGPKITQGQIWCDDDTKWLKLTYNKHQGELPCTGDYSNITATIDTVFAIGVPVPGAASLFLLDGFLFLARRFRGKYRH